MTSHPALRSSRSETNGFRASATMPRSRGREIWPTCNVTTWPPSSMIFSEPTCATVEVAALAPQAGSPVPRKDRPRGAHVNGEVEKLRFRNATQERHIRACTHRTDHRHRKTNQSTTLRQLALGTRRLRRQQGTCSCSGSWRPNVLSCRHAICPARF